MRLSLLAAAAFLLTAQAGFAAEAVAVEDELDDLVLVTAQPRSADVKMVVQIATVPAPSAAETAKAAASKPLTDAAVSAEPLKTAAR
jgi:hypothetical protein